MEFCFRRVDSLPQLAWCARVERASPTVIVAHGSSVETIADGFVEGAWPASFLRGGFVDSPALMGSGAKIVSGAIVLATPCHTLERLHLVRRGERLLASNSLPFLVAAAGLELDPGYRSYKNDLWSINHGLRRCVRALPTLGGPRVVLSCFANVEITSNLDIREIPKPAPTPWADFSEYRRFLADTLAGLAENAAAPERQVRYELLASISSGYDSAAAAALAADAGCHRAVTFRIGIDMTTRAPTEDSGAPIARLLGMEVREFDRDEGLASSDVIAAEFAAGGDTFDRQLSAFEPSLGRALLITGFNGDSIWDRTNPDVSPHFVRQGVLSGASLGEFRLRVGFLHCPVPNIGAVHHPAIHAITVSPEMAPWTLGTDYDRPIARRILEERGVPRGFFGTRKSGSFRAVQNLRIAQSRSAAFEAYFARHQSTRGKIPRVRDEVSYLVAGARSRVTAWFERHRLPHLLAPVRYVDIPVPGRPSLVVPWGVAALADRYLPGARALGSAP